MDQSKRHHYVPKFYLRNFGDRKKRIRVYRCGATSSFVTSVANAAVQTGFYTVILESGDQSLEIEALLSQIENDAAVALERLCKGIFPPAKHDREMLSLLMALQLLRTPEHRRVNEAIADTYHKVLLQGWTPDYVRQRLLDGGLEATDEAIAQVMEVVENPDKYKFVPHQNEHISTMLHIGAGELAPVILSKSWVLGKCRSSTFITSDHPIVYHKTIRSDEDKILGVGLLNSDEVYFPLDRKHVLILGQPSVFPERIISIPSDVAQNINRLIASYAYEWVFQCPDDDPIDKMIPDSRRPLLEMNGKEVFPE